MWFGTEWDRLSRRIQQPVDSSIPLSRYISSSIYCRCIGGQRGERRRMITRPRCIRPLPFIFSFCFYRCLPRVCPFAVSRSANPTNAGGMLLHFGDLLFTAPADEQSFMYGELSLRSPLHAEDMLIRARFLMHLIGNGALGFMGSIERGNTCPRNGSQHLPRARKGQGEADRRDFSADARLTRCPPRDRLEIRWRVCG